MNQETHGMNADGSWTSSEVKASETTAEVIAVENNEPGVESARLIMVNGVSGPNSLFGSTGTFGISGAFGIGTGAFGITGVREAERVRRANLPDDGPGGFIAPYGTVGLHESMNHNWHVRPHHNAAANVAAEVLHGQKAHQEATLLLQRSATDRIPRVQLRGEQVGVNRPLETREESPVATGMVLVEEVVE